MSRRGLTLIEVLLSVALLSIIMITTLAWTQTIGAAGPRLAGPASIERDLQSVLRLIADDVAMIERTVRRDVVREDGEALVIQSRHASEPPFGAVELRYRFHRSGDGRLERSERPQRGVTVSRTVLTGLDTFECDVLETARLLVISIEAGGVEATRVVRW